MSLNTEITRYNDFIRDYTTQGYNLNQFIAEFGLKGFLKDSNDFLLKSYMIFFLRFIYFVPDTIFQGKLIQNSANCKFTISQINNQDSFVKIVDNISTNDLLLYDTVTGYILNKILAENQEFNRFKKCLVKYKYSFLSYYNTIQQDSIINSFWNYNNLIQYDYQLMSPYHFNNINNIPNYYKECYVYISDVVKGNAKSYGSIIREYINNPSMNNLQSAFVVIGTMSIIYEFLELLSVNYGYIHNDLHSGNILFDDVENCLVIIDYGRNVFQYFCDNQDSKINQFINDEIYKLNLLSKFNDDINLDYNKIIISSNFKYNIPSVKFNNKYLGGIFDIITLSLSLYKFLILINKKRNYTQLINIINLFETLIKFEGDITSNSYKIKIVNPTANISDILDIYNTNRQNNIVDEYLKKTCLYIYDGLLLFILLLKNRGLNELNFRTHKRAILFINGFQIAYLNNTDLDNYLTYLYGIVLQYPNKFNDCIIIQKILTTGGKLSSIISKSIINKSIINKSIKRILRTYNNKSKSIIKNKKSIIENYKDIFDYIETNKLSIKYK